MFAFFVVWLFVPVHVGRLLLSLAVGPCDVWCVTLSTYLCVGIVISKIRDWFSKISVFKIGIFENHCFQDSVEQILSQCLPQIQVTATPSAISKMGSILNTQNLFPIVQGGLDTSLGG